MSAKYKRVLLKLSGEQLTGSSGASFDTEVASWLAEEVKKAAKDTQIAIMIGGGNFVRGAQLANKEGISRVTADYMGMLGTLINALALTDIFEHHGLPTRCLSNIYAEQVAEPFAYRLADKHLRDGNIVIAAGGLGKPYITTDTAAVALALELDCQVVLKATKVDGVYDKDPALHQDAHRIEKMDFQEAVKNPSIKIMDKSALGLAMEHNMPVIVFDTMRQGNIDKAVTGHSIGTLIN